MIRNILSLLLILDTLAFLSYGGYIYFSNTEILYQNAKSAQNFTFTFSLESGISSNDFFYLKFPFSLGTFASSSTIPKATISLASNNDGSNEVFYQAQGSADLNYFFNFQQEIQKNTWYSLKIIASDSSVALQNEGFQGILEFYTVSSVSPNRIYYDSNTIFDQLQLSPPPSSDLIGNCTVHQDNVSIYHNPDAILTAYFDLQINDANKFGSVLQFSMNDDTFSFINSCTLKACNVGLDYPSCSNDITYKNTNSKCLVVNSKQIKLIIYSPIQKSMNLRIQTFIKNPLIITQSTDTSYIKVKQLNSFTSFILNTISISCGLQVIIIELLSNIIQLFWGLESTSLTNNAGCPIVLYSLPVSPKVIPWNNIKLTFSITKKTPSLPLKIKVDLTNSFQDILIGSIATNLPSHLSSRMKCQIQNSQYLYCGNFSNMIAYSSYYISFKITIKNTVTSTLIIGGIQFINSDNDIQYTNMLYPSTSLIVLINEEYLDLAGNGINSAASGGYSNMNYNQMISYDDIDSMNYNYGKADNGLGIGDMISSSPDSMSSIKYPVASQASQKIIIFLQVSSLQLCQNIASRCFISGSNGDHTMLKIVFNNNILGISSTNFEKGIELIESIFADVHSSSNILKCGDSGWCSKYDTYSTQTTKINQIFTKSASSTQYNSYHHVTVICQTPTGAAIKQCHQIVGRDKIYGLGTNRPGFSALAFRGAKLTTYPSFYADNDVFDFIFCFKHQSYSTSGTNNVASTDESQWTLSSSGLVPAYIITNGFYKPYLKVSWINYYAKASEGLNSDNYLPFILRIGGKFESSESSSIFTGNRVSIFLGSGVDITSYKEGSASESSNDFINCGNSEGSILSCRIYPFIGSGSTQPNVWTNEQRIEFDYTFSGDSDFNFYIPIKPVYLSHVIYTLNSLSLVIMTQTDSGLTVNGVYRLVGSVAQNDYSFKQVSEANTKFDVAQGFWSGFGASMNCENVGFPNIDTSVTIKPNSYYSTTFKINTQISGNNNLNCLNLKEGSEINGWGIAFTMASDINIFETITSLVWDFDGVVNGVTTNKCVFLNYRLPLLDKRIYSIVCPVDTYSGISSPTIGGGYKYLLLKNIIWPWWWGDSSMPSNIIRYGWSRSDGPLIAYRSESTRIYSQSSCVNGDFFMIKGSNYMKYALIVTPGILMTLNSTTNFNNFFLRLNLNSSTLTHVQFEGCEFVFENYDFVCVLAKFSNYIDFYITYKDDEEMILDQQYSLNIYISNDDRTIQDYYYLKIYSPLGFYSENFLIDTCAYACFFNNKITNSPSSKLELYNLSYIPTKNVLTTYLFTFNSLTRDILKGTQIKINLGFLSFSLSSDYDLKCQIFQGNNISQLSYQWETIELISIETLLITTKSDIFNNYEFTVKCFGGRTPFTDSLLNFTAQIIQKNSLNSLQTSNNISAISFFTEPDVFPSLKLTKNLSYMGLEANYFFKFILHNEEINSDGRIIISFPTKIPTKLNSQEFFKCYLNDILVFCKLLDENLLSVSCNTVLSGTSNEEYSLDVYGISQPNMTDSSSGFLETTIAFMIDDDNNITNGILVYGEVKDDFENNNILIKGIGILDLNFSNNLTQDFTDSYIRIKLAAGSIESGNQIYIKLEHSFYKSLLQNYNVSCFLYNEADVNYSTNFVKEKCQRIDVLKIEMDVETTDSNNSVPQIYHLYLSNLSSPIDFSPLQIQPLIEIFYVISGNTLFRSASGFINATFPKFYQSTSMNLNWFYYEKLNETFVQSADSYVDVFIGRYSSIIGLSLLEGLFNITFNFSLIGNDSSNFLIFPSYNPSVIKGQTINGFYIAAKNNVSAGVYFLKFEKILNGDPEHWTSPIPPLLINLKAEKCQISTYFDSYEIPIGKISFPIYLDFDYCAPIENITIFANITFGHQEYYMSFFEDDNLYPNFNKTLAFNNGTFNKISFVIKNQDIYQNLTVNLTGIMSFKFYGANANFYLPPKDIKLKLVDSISFKTPPVPSIPKVQLYKNTIKITTKCSQPSQIFYSLRTKNYESNFTYKTIQLKLSTLSSTETQRDSSDPYWTIFGSNIQNAYESLYLNITNLKSRAKYYFCYFCLNKFLVISPIAPNTSWTQSDNGGRTIKLSFTFQDSISDIFKNKISCSLSQILAVSDSQLFDSNGKICAESRLLENLINSTYSTTNSSNSTNSTNETISNLTYYIYVFFVLPNHQMATDSVQDDIKKIIDTSGDMNFAQKVIKNTNSATSYPLIKNFTYKIYSNPQMYAPTGNISEINATVSSILISVSLNDSGFIVLALNPNSENKPSFEELKNGLDKKGNTLSIMEIVNINKGEIYSKNFSNLNESSLYYLWYALWNDDPSLNGIHGNVNELSVKTNASLTGLVSIIQNYGILWIYILIMIHFF